jgi:ankyrin repeat protein
MSELERLMAAAERGALDDVRAAIDAQPELIKARDDDGATLLHYAAFGGHRPLVELLVERGADINAMDGHFHATPAGWAIEYLRERGGFLGIELADFAFAIGKGDVEWVARFLKRFPGLREATDAEGVPFRVLADRAGNEEIAQLFERVG